jgi:hypothetical protein
MGGSKTRLLVIATALLLVAGPAWSQHSAPPSVAAYSRAMADSTVTVERLFDLGEQAAQDLMRGGLDAYSREEIFAVSKQMPGYALQNTNVVFALAEVKFFKDLSLRRGRPQDIAFFAALAVEYPDDSSYMPDYIQRTTHDQGCLRLDGSISRIDGSWRRYREAYPQSYARHVAEHLDEIEDEIVRSNKFKHVCACGDRPPAERELTDLAKLGPQDRLGKNAAELLRGVRDGSVHFKAQCRPN